MAKLRSGRWPLLAGGVLLLAVLACQSPFGAASKPAVAITSPAAGASVPVNQPVPVQVEASDPDGAGVFRIDLQVDGVTVDSFESGGPQAQLAASLSFTPAVEGVAVSVGAIAFREDGTASDPASIALSVVGASAAEPLPTPEPTAESDSEEEESSSSGDGVIRVEAMAKVDVPIRERASPFCLQIGVWKKGDTGFLLIRTTSPTEWWYQTDYLGPDNLGWVYQGQEQLNFQLLESDDLLPRVPEQGCLGCGDGVCSESIGEACDLCLEDCGACPFCGDGEVNQGSEQCDGGGCDTGFFCTDSCICEQEAFCGDGNVDPGEQCDGGGCNAGFVCNASCTCQTQPLSSVPSVP